MNPALPEHTEEILTRIRHGLIVSCQARPDDALYGSEMMARMAQAARDGGAVGIRANSPPDIRAIKHSVALPIIGIYKKEYPGSDVYITPTMEEIRAVADAGADIIALDATLRPRPGNQTLDDIIATARKEYDVLLMADIATLEEGVNAAESGFDIVATTLGGYTDPSRISREPDLELVEQLAKSVTVPVIAEGRLNTPEQAAEAIRRGAWAVVVGTAITRPHVLTRRFADAIKDA